MLRTFASDNHVISTAQCKLQQLSRGMLLVDNVDSREFLAELLTAMYEELPAPKKKK